MKTALILLGEYIGITDVELFPGEVIRFNEKMDPLVIREVLDTPKTVGTSLGAESLDDIEWQTGWDKVAYLTYNAAAVKKYGQRRTSQKREKEFASSIGGNTQVGSGAFAFHKGDAKSKLFLGEHKYTDAKKYSLSWTTWVKITKEAREIDKVPVMEIVIDQASKDCIKLRVMEINSFLELTDSSEADFVNGFFSQSLTPRKGAASIPLSKLEIQTHIDHVMENIPYHFPAFLLMYRHGTLVAMESRIMDKLFND